jgi:hypothetical protein
MTKSKRWTRKLDVSKPAPHPRMPVALMLRMFLVGSVAVGAAGYAIYRHYYVARPSMLMPVPPSTELPAPELTPLPPPR